MRKWYDISIVYKVNMMSTTRYIFARLYMYSTSTNRVTYTSILYLVFCGSINLPLYLNISLAVNAKNTASKLTAIGLKPLISANDRTAEVTPK